MKKQYKKPSNIDLSIEGMTGFDSGSVSGFNPACNSGGGGFKINAADCEGGLTANNCWDGNSNVGGFS